VLRELLPLAMSKELVTRHGATLAIAEVVAALCKLGHTIPDDVQSTVRNLVPKIEKARLYVSTNATPLLTTLPRLAAHVVCLLYATGIAGEVVSTCARQCAT